MMLNLKLRDEFLGSQMPGTAIALRRKDNTGAAQRTPDFILSITYPTADVQTALRAVSTDRSKRPIVLMGDRGRGKSHIMAVMHHAVESSSQVQKWANKWGNRLGAQPLSGLVLDGAFFAISEPVHNQEYPLLWDLIFERHPKGDFFRGKFNQMGRPYPPRSLLEEMFEAQPVALILDEFQKWFDGLSDQPGPEGIKYRTLAENFIQNLSELSKDRPDILILVVSVLNNNTEAFRQVHRDGPIIVDFRGPTAKEDRLGEPFYSLPVTEYFLLIFGSLASIEASNNKRCKIQGFDLSFISKPSGRGVYWQDMWYGVRPKSLSAMASTWPPMPVAALALERIGRTLPYLVVDFS
jgi:hypothetical protein